MFLFSNHKLLKFLVCLATTKGVLPTLAWTTLSSYFVLPSSKIATRRYSPSIVFARSKDTDDALRLEKILMEQDDNRKVPSLQEWAVSQGISIADGVELVNNGMGDWGVGLTGAETINNNSTTYRKGSAIMTIPKGLILSSSDIDDVGLIESITASMTKANLNYFVPECLLVLRVLQECSLGASSPWYPWLESLPKSFDTGLYLNELEASHVQRLAPDFLRQQQLQFRACQIAIQSTVQSMPMYNEVAAYLKKSPEDDDIIRWAFSVVFTRSWRSQQSSEDIATATLVPLGDMFNHADGEYATIIPNMIEKSKEEQIVMTLSKDTMAGTNLHLSYGLTTHPGRFLVVFGFWDRSAPFMDANLTVPDAYKVNDPSQLVVSTRNGGITQEVLDLATFRFLQQSKPEEAKRWIEAQQTGPKEESATVVSKLSETYELEGVLFLRMHVLKLLAETYPGALVCTRVV